MPRMTVAMMKGVHHNVLRTAPAPGTQRAAVLAALPPGIFVSTRDIRTRLGMRSDQLDRTITALRNEYLIDIRSIKPGLICRVGEWIDNHYIDHLT